MQTLRVSSRVDAAVIRVAVALAALACCYTGVLTSLIGTWSSSPVYSYGFAVPIISGYIIWSKRQTLQTLHLAPDYLYGVPLLLAGIGALVAGHLGALVSVQQGSLVVTLVGLVLLLWGRQPLKVLWFPLAYLVLMVPIWDYPISRLQDPSRLLSGAIAVRLLRLFDVPALQEGTTIVLPRLTLQILRECSGVNQLIAITAMTLPVSYLFLHGRWRRIVLMIAGVGVAYLSNGVRIALVGFLAHQGLGNGQLTAVHLFEGLFVSVAGYAVLGGCLSILSRQRNRRLDTTSAVPPHTVRFEASPVRRPWIEAGVLGVALFAGAHVWLFEPREVLLAEDLHSLPRQIEGWTIDHAVEPVPARFPAMRDEVLDAYPSSSGERRFTEADDELIRTYRRATGERVRLYIGYHRSQQEGKELTGQASLLLNTAASPLSLQFDSKTLLLNEVVDRNAEPDRGLLFWYDVNGRTVRNIYLAKAYTLLDALTRHRTNGAVVMIEWDGLPGVPIDASRHEAIQFVRALLPLLPAYIPS